MAIFIPDCQFSALILFIQFLLFMKPLPATLRKEEKKLFMESFILFMV